MQFAWITRILIKIFSLISIILIKITDVLSGSECKENVSCTMFVNIDSKSCLESQILWVLIWFTKIHGYRASLPEKNNQKQRQIPNPQRVAHNRENHGGTNDICKEQKEGAKARKLRKELEIKKVAECWAVCVVYSSRMSFGPLHYMLWYIKGFFLTKWNRSLCWAPSPVLGYFMVDLLRLKKA